MVAHVRHAGAGAGRGVEPAHVVADLVWADLRELGALAEAGRAPLARQHAGRALREQQVERLDEGAADRARSLGAGGRDERGATDAAGRPSRGRAPPPPPPPFASAAPTAPRIRASTSSAATPSPSAS